jgi:hypothetical protein
VKTVDIEDDSVTFFDKDSTHLNPTSAGIVRLTLQPGDLAPGRYIVEIPGGILEDASQNVYNRAGDRSIRITIAADSTFSWPAYGAANIGIYPDRPLMLSANFPAATVGTTYNSNLGVNVWKCSDSTYTTCNSDAPVVVSNVVEVDSFAGIFNLRVTLDLDPVADAGYTHYLVEPSRDDFYGLNTYSVSLPTPGFAWAFSAEPGTSHVPQLLWPDLPNAKFIDASNADVAAFGTAADQYAIHSYIQRMFQTHDGAFATMPTSPDMYLHECKFEACDQYTSTHYVRASEMPFELVSYLEPGTLF